MLFRSFARQLLLMFSLCVVATASILATKFGLFGSSAQAQLDAIWVPLQQAYDARRAIIDPAVQWVGFLGSVFLAVWTIHKGWHYAERSLPARLNELNARWKDAAIRRRPDVIPVLREVVSIAPLPGVQRGFFSRAIAGLFNNDQQELLAYSGAADTAAAELAVLANAQERCRAELMTTYLQMGTQLARCAPDNGSGVLGIFKRSLEFNDKDLDALELSARQAFAIGLEHPAFNFLSELEVAASEARDHIRQALASRFQAELLLRRGSQTALADARARLSSNVSILAKLENCDPHRRSLELALTYERLAEVQIAREKFSAADTAIDEAMKLFGALGAPLGHDGIKRLRALTSRLTKAKTDKDNSEVPD